MLPPAPARLPELSLALHLEDATAWQHGEMLQEAAPQSSRSQLLSSWIRCARASGWVHILKSPHRRVVKPASKRSRIHVRQMATLKRVSFSI